MSLIHKMETEYFYLLFHIQIFLNYILTSVIYIHWKWNLLFLKGEISKGKTPLTAEMFWQRLILFLNSNFSHLVFVWSCFRFSFNFVQWISHQYIDFLFQDHLQVCLKLPTACHLHCGKEAIPRDMMEEHLNKECPKAEVLCPFTPHGCYFKVS